jgi:hypothetical protein
VKNYGSMEKRPRQWKGDLEVHVEGGENNTWKFDETWYERKDADLTASSSDGKTDRPASRYASSQNHHLLEKRGYEVRKELTITELRRPTPSRKEAGSTTRLD